MKPVGRFHAREEVSSHYESTAGDAKPRVVVGQTRAWQWSRVDKQHSGAANKWPLTEKRVLRWFVQQPSLELNLQGFETSCLIEAS
jgi:hypothetical protein